MKILSGMILMPFLLRNSRGSEKIDSRLLKKTRTLGLSSIPAIIFTKEGKTKICRHYLESKGVKIKYELPLINAYAVEIEGGKLEDTARADVVEYISDDMKINSLLNVAAQEVGARIANDTGYTGRGIGIAILDTGIYPHQDFTKPRNRIIAFKDFVNNKQNPYDDNGHGTFVAGVAAGNGYASGGKYKGVAPEANLIGVKVMDKNGSGNSSDIIAGMQWVADHHKEYNIRVMSLSLGAKPPTGSRFDPLAAAVEAVWKKGIIVIAAAGNAGPKQNTIATPGVSPVIITVGAVDDKRTADYKDDVIADFSSRGPVNGRQVKPDIVAPGVGITAANTDKEYTGGLRTEVLKEPYTKMSGTSVATPVVSGAAAVMLSKNPKMTPAEFKELIMKNAFNMGINKYAQGSGILDIKKCLSL
ncbi:MAG TPA: S8 family peptidase [Clostridiales bacterium]|nr:S8 family peptidase [Clostridiales bacterium]